MRISDWSSDVCSSDLKLGLDIADVQARNPEIVYACGTGCGPRGDDASKGGYDAISFWARSGVAAAATPPGYGRPVNQPSGAFGDSISGKIGRASCRERVCKYG